MFWDGLLQWELTTAEVVWHLRAEFLETRAVLQPLRTLNASHVSMTESLS